MTRRPDDTRPPGRAMRGRAHVHPRTYAGKVARMTDDWDRAHFQQVFEHLRKAAKIKDPTTVAKLADIDASTVSNWLNPKKKQRPTPGSLSAVARVFGVNPFVLWEAAGFLEPGASDRFASPAADEAQLRTIPAEMEELADLFDQLDPTGQDAIRTQIRMAIAWARSELSRSGNQDAERTTRE